MSLTFLLTSFVICVSPGTGALYSIAAGLTRGARAGVLAAFACTLGVVPHVVAAITGLAALLHASGVAFAVVKYAGVGLSRLPRVGDLARHRRAVDRAGTPAGRRAR